MYRNGFCRPCVSKVKKFMKYHFPGILSKELYSPFNQSYISDNTGASVGEKCRQVCPQFSSKGEYVSQSRQDFVPLISICQDKIDISETRKKNKQYTTVSSFATGRSIDQCYFPLLQKYLIPLI